MTEPTKQHGKCPECEQLTKEKAALQEDAKYWYRCLRRVESFKEPLEVRVPWGKYFRTVNLCDLCRWDPNLDYCPGYWALGECLRVTMDSKKDYKNVIACSFFEPEDPAGMEKRAAEKAEKRRAR
jgi:hypothetical protein